MARYVCTNDCFDCRGVRRSPGDVVDYDESEHISKWFAPVATDGSAVEKVAAQRMTDAPNTLSELQREIAEPTPVLSEPEQVIAAMKQEKPKAPAKAKSTTASKSKTKK